MEASAAKCAVAASVILVAVVVDFLEATGRTEKRQQSVNRFGTRLPDSLKRMLWPAEPEVCEESGCGGHRL